VTLVYCGYTPNRTELVCWLRDDDYQRGIRWGPDATMEGEPAPGVGVGLRKF